MTATWKHHLGLGWTMLLSIYGLAALFCLWIAWLGDGSLAESMARGMGVAAITGAIFIGTHLAGREMHRQQLWLRRLAPLRHLRQAPRALAALLLLLLGLLALPPLLLTGLAGQPTDAAMVALNTALAICLGVVIAVAWQGGFGGNSTVTLLALGLAAPLLPSLPTGWRALILTCLLALGAHGLLVTTPRLSVSPAERFHALWERWTAMWRSRFRRLVPQGRRAGFGVVIFSQLPLAIARDAQGGWMAASVWASLAAPNTLLVATLSLATALALTWDGLLGQQLHWRHQLAPHGVRRSQLGWQIVRSTAQAWLMGLLFLLGTLTFIGLLSGMLAHGLDSSGWQQAGVDSSTVRLIGGALAQLTLDLGCGLIMGVWLRGLRRPGWQCLVLALLWLAGATLLLWSFGQRGPGSLVLLALTAIALAKPIQVAWSRADLSGFGRPR